MNKEKILDEILETLNDEILLAYFCLLEQCKVYRGAIPATLAKIYGEGWEEEVKQKTVFGELIANLVRKGLVPLVAADRNTENHKLYIADHNFSFANKLVQEALKK